jgi:hypothetical protein
LEERTAEFNRLRLLQLKDSKENSALKMRLQEMKIANDSEKRLLEQQVSKLIHSQAGYIASQKEKISHLQVALQDELTISQNRIAEQEQEIKWLKKALDETNNYASKDQIDKMQHVIDVWQTQAKNAHHELTVVLGQAEELKTLNAQLLSKITELESTKKQLSDEVSERAVECGEVTSKLYEVMKEKEDAQELQRSLSKAYEEAKSLLQEKRQSIQDQEAVLTENRRLMDSLQEELHQGKQRIQQEQQQLKLANNRIADLERDKVELTHKLNAVMDKFERKSQQMMEEIHDKINSKEKLVEDVQSQYEQTKTELDGLKVAYDELKDLTDLKMQQKSKALEDAAAALQKELDSNAKLSGQLLIAEGENEGLKDKISRLSIKLKERNEAFQQSTAEKDATIADLQADLANLKTHFEQQAKAIAQEMERNIKDMETLHADELQQLREQFEQQHDAQKMKYQSLLEKYNHDLKEQEALYQQKLVDAETKMKLMVDQELDGCVQRMEAQHRQQVATILSEQADKLKSSLQQLTEHHQLDKELIIREQEDKWQAALQHAEAEHQQKISTLLQEQTASLQATVTQLRTEHDTKLNKALKKLEQEKDHLHQQRLREVKQELEEAFALEKHALQTEAQEALSAVQVKHDQELQQIYAAHQQQLHQDVQQTQQQHITALDRIKTEHQSQLDKQQVLFQDMLALEKESLLSGFQREKKEALSQLEAKLQVAHEQQLSQALNAQQLQLSQTHKEQLQQALRQLTEQLEQAHQEQETAWLQQQDKTVQQLQLKHQQQQQEMTRKQEQEWQITLTEKLQQKDEIAERKVELLKAEYAKTLQVTVAEERQLAKQQEREEVTKRLQVEYEHRQAKAVEQAVATTQVELLRKHDVAIQQTRQALLEESAKQMKSLEANFTAMLAEKEDVITQLNQQLKQLISAHHDELSSALFDQQTALIDKSKSELEKFRAEYTNRELVHQTELNSMIQSHAKELVAQRTDMEERFEKIISALKEENRLVQSRLHDVMEAQASQQSQDSLSKLEMKLKYEDMLHQQQVTLQQQHEEVVQRLQQQVQQEGSKWKAQLEQIQQQHEEDNKQRDSQLRQELLKVKTSWKEKNQLDIQQVQEQHEQDLATIREQLAKQRADELQRLHDDYQHQLHTKSLQLQELELKASHWQAQLLENTKKLSQDKVELIDSYQQQLAQQAEHASEALQQLETRYQEAEVQLKARHKQLLDQLRQDYEQQLSQQATDNALASEQRDLFHQQEIQNLKKLLQEQQEARQLEGQRYQEDYGHQRNDLLKHQDEIKQLKLRFQEDKQTWLQQHEEELRTLKQRHLDEKERWQQVQIDTHAHQVESLQQEHQRVLQSLKDKQDRDITALQHRVEALQAEHEQHLSAAKRQYAQQVQDLNDSHQAEAEKWMLLLKSDRSNWDELQQQLLAEKAQLKLSLEREQMRWAQDKETALQELQAHLDSEWSKKVQSLQQQCQHIKEDAGFQLEKLEDAYQRKLKMQEEEFLAVEEDWKSKVDEERAHKERLAESHQLLLASLEQEHAAAKAEWSQSKEAEVQQIKAQHDTEISSMQRILSQEMQSVKDKLVHASQDADHKIMTIEKHYQTALKSKDAELLALQQQMRQRQVEETQIVASLESRHQRALQDTKREYEDAQDVLQTKLQDQVQEADRRAQRDKVEKDRLQNKVQALEKEVQHYQEQLQEQLMRQDRDVALQLQDVQAQHQRTIDSLRRHEQVALQQVQEDFALESQALRQRLDMLESRNKELEQKVVQKTMLVDTAATEKHDVSLQLQLAQQQVQKLETQLAQVNQKLEADMSVQAQVKKAQLALQQQVDQLSKEVQDKQTEVVQSKQQAQQSVQHVQQLTQQLQQLEVDARIAKGEAAKDLKEALEQQKQALQEEHLQSIKQQMDLIVALIQTQSSSSSQSNQQHFQDLQNRFLHLIQDLPEIWKEKHRMLLTEIGGLNPPPAAVPPTDNGSPLNSPRGGDGRRGNSVPRTPIRILADASADYYPAAGGGGSRAPYFDESSQHSRMLQKKGLNNNNNLNNNSNVRAAHQPWSSPSLRASPTDQLIAAILDGDVQGIRAVVRSKGEDLQSEFWYDLSRSILPLHRAISGLHFHGSEKLLVATIEVLVQLGAEVNAVDHAGNSALHKAILLCTSKSVVSVVHSLISKGANTSVINKEGDTPLHVECKR